MTDKQESMQGIVKLYELRREETMREARGWFFHFYPASAEEVSAAYFGPQTSGGRSPHPRRGRSALGRETFTRGGRHTRRRHGMACR
jgi:hypothetical protein